MSLCEENLKIYNESDNAFCVLHTSGSTGKPKCTALKHKNMVNFINSNNNLKFNRYVDNVIAINTITFDVFEMDTIFALAENKK